MFWVMVGDRVVFSSDLLEVALDEADAFLGRYRRVRVVDSSIWAVVYDVERCSYVLHGVEI